MSYEPTIWNPGGPPGISAARLNKIEQGIADATDIAKAALPASQYTASDVMGKTVIPYRAASASGNDYPEGMSVFAVTGGIADGWPTNLGVVTTKKHSNLRMFQEFVVVTTGGASDGRTHRRIWRSDTGWSPFRRIWDDAEMGAGSGLDADRWSGWTMYDSVTQLGLVEGTETMEAICGAMANQSVLVYAKLTGNTSPHYPASTGLLTITRRREFRTELIFTHLAGAGPRMWVGFYDSNATPKFSGWDEVAFSGRSNTFTTNQTIKNGGNYQYWGVRRDIGSDEYGVDLGVGADGKARLGRRVNGSLETASIFLDNDGAYVGNNKIWDNGNSSRGSNANGGYQRLASGLLLQWGAKTSVPPNTNTDITFPIAFADPPQTVSVTVDSDDPSTASTAAGTATKIRVKHDDPTTRTILWFAIGL